MYKPKKSVRKKVVEINGSSRFVTLTMNEIVDYISAVAVVDMVGNLAVYGVVS